MKLLSLRGYQIAAVALAAFCTAAAVHAQPLYSLQKRQAFRQTATNTLLPDGRGAFRFGASASTSGVILTVPGGASYQLAYGKHEDNYGFARTFTTKAALDAAFPNGIYTLTGPGIGTVTISLTGDLYPVAPQIVGGNWSANGLLLLTPGVATSLNLNTFSTYATAGAIGHVYAEYNGAGVQLDTQVFSRAVPGVPGLTVSAQPLTSFALTAASLVNNTGNNGDVEYDTFATLDTTTIGGGNALLVGYGSDLDFTAAVLNSGTGAATPPVIATQPTNQSAALGAQATFPVAVTIGGVAVAGASYDWHLNGDFIESNGTDPKYSRTANGGLIVKNITASDAGIYTLQFWNTGGSVTSNAATLTVTGLASRPLIVTPPASQTVSVGQNATLSVVPTAGGTLLYQWSKDGALIPGAKSSTLVLSNVQAGTAGSYTVTVSNESGFITSNAAVVTVSAGPGITTQPVSQTVAAAASVNLSVVATGSGATYQWKKNGVAIAGATSATYTITSAQTGDMGFYSCTVASGGGSTDSATATITVTAGSAARPINISTRALVTTAEPLTAGFVLSGAKTLLIRASGPALAQFGVPGTLADPKLEIIPLGGSTPVASNNDWGTVSNLAALTAAATANGAFPFPTGSKDAAVLVTLPAGGYTANITGADGGSGVALVEVYDTDPLTSAGQLINISARATVGTGANNLATGFVVSGVAPRQVLIRAIGPTLAAFGVAGALLDPQLTVIPAGASYRVATNDNWNGSTALKTAFTSVGAFALDDASKDAVVLLRLPPGGYTAVVAGVGGTTGTAIVEVYDLGP